MGRGIPSPTHPSGCHLNRHKARKEVSRGVVSLFLGWDFKKLRRGMALMGVDRRGKVGKDLALGLDYSHPTFRGMP